VEETCSRNQKYWLLASSNLGQTSPSLASTPGLPLQNFASTALPGTAALRFQSPPQVCPSSFLRIRRTWSRRSNRPRKFSKWSSPAPKAAGSIRSSSVRGSSSGPAQPVQSNFRFISSVTGRPFYNDEPPGSSQPNPSGTDKLCVADCRPPASYDWGVGGTLGHD